MRANLARVLPGASAAALDRAVSETFANFAACFADLLTINRGDPARLRDYVAETEGEEDLDAACAPGRGVILLTAHVGNWDLGGRLLAPRLDRTTHVVLAGGGRRAGGYLRRDEPRLRFRRGGARRPLGLLAALRRNEVRGDAGDRPTGGRGDTHVDFFGAPGAFPIGPFVLARAAGAPVVPAFCAMTPEGRYRISMEPPIWVKSGEEGAALATAVGALERVIRRHPTQWFNFFDVWGASRAAA